MRSFRSMLLAALCVCTSVAACGDDGANPNDGDVIVIGDTGNGSGDAGGDTGLPPCDDNLDCAGGELCRDGVCREACGGDADCSGEFPICDMVEGVCIGCLADDDCGDGSVCDVELRVCTDAECTEDSDCAGGFTCQDGRCASIDEIICEADSARCESGVLYECSRDGTREEAISCDDSLCYDDGEGLAECRQFICDANAVGCADDFTATLCDATGTVLDEFPCIDGRYCEGGTCLPQVCEPEVMTCEGDVAVACDSRGATSTTTICAETEGCLASDFGCACVDGACEERVCTPGTSQCAGNGRRDCIDGGLAWSTIESCGDESICIEGTCLDLICEPGSVTCAGEQVATCGADGTTRELLDCGATAQLCVADADGAGCAAPICTPDAVRCGDVGESVVTCDARGATESTVGCATGRFCSGGACLPQVCVPGGATVCLDGDARQCDARGTGYVTIDDCAAGTELCSGGVCRAIVCSAGTTRCDGERLRVCSADGLAETVTDCATSSQWCDEVTDSCRARTCTPDLGPVCRDGDVQRCDSRGTAWQLVRECGEFDCFDGACDTPCGDGQLDDGEECDEGASNGPSGTCTSECALNRAVLCAGVSDARCVVLSNTGASSTVRESYTIPRMAMNLAFDVDGTGSNQPLRDTFRTAWPTQLGPTIRANEADSSFAFTTHNGFPNDCDPFGGTDTSPYMLRQRVTSNLTTLNAAVATDYPEYNDAAEWESLNEALFQIAAGFGTDLTPCAATDIPAFNPALNNVPGVAAGTLGGVGFDNNTLRAAVYVTDNPPFDKSRLDIPVGAALTETIRALRRLDIRPVGIVAPDGFGDFTLADHDGFAIEAGSYVSPCAWDGSRGALCATGLCCTGDQLSGRAPIDGLCPLVYDVDADALDVLAAVSDLLQRLRNNLRWDVTLVARPNATSYSATGLDTSCFVREVRAVGAAAGVPTCGGAATIGDARAAGAGDALTNLPAGVAASFDIELSNGCVGPTTETQTYDLTISFATVGGREFEAGTWRVIIPPIPPAGAVRCGDGFVGGSEQCDDGNPVNDDLCTNSCRLPRCGDGALNSAPGNATFTAPLVAVGGGVGYVCDDGATCPQSTCNVRLNPTAPEHGVCQALGYTWATTVDWRGTVGFSGTLAYALDWFCINGDCETREAPTVPCLSGEMLASVRCEQTLEQCDNGASNANAADACRTTCVLPRCGDVIRDSGEECDDGDNDDFDGCSSFCLTRRCGNGAFEPTRGEECDNGASNANLPDACRTTCRLPVCGDAIADSGEECDDGNAVDGDGCTSACELPSCGNGVTESPEECDDGNISDADLCLTTCQDTECGDGIVQSVRGEACDDGNSSDTDACTTSCAFGPLCVSGNLGSATGPAIASGTITGRTASFSASCGGTARGPDIAYTWTAPATRSYRFDTFGAATTFDTVLHVRNSTAGAVCGTAEANVCTTDVVGATTCCDDDTSGGTVSTQSGITLNATAGTRYLIVVDSYYATANGTWVLNVTPL